MEAPPNHPNLDHFSIYFVLNAMVTWGSPLGNPHIVIYSEWLRYLYRTTNDK